MKFSILIIAVGCHYSHVARFISNLKQENPEVEIHYFTNKKIEEIPDEIINNVENIIYQEQKKKKGSLVAFNKLFSLRKQFKDMSRNNRYDIIDIHFPKYFMAVTMRYLHKMSRNVVVSPWGSDILRVDGIEFKLLLNGVLKKCDYITTPMDGNIGKRIISNLPNSRSKFRPLYWGSETIDYLTSHFAELDTQTAKTQFGLNGRYVITCGYNAFPAQNHEKIIDAISVIQSQLPENLTLLFPVSYGFQDKDIYVEKIKEKCKEKQLDAVFVEKYLSVADVCKLRMATDLFIHVQNTDAGCASLQEYILCGKKVVHGSWIHYPMLERYQPLCFYPSPDFSSLSSVILEAYNSEGINVTQEVFAIIRQNGWIQRRKEWNDLFESLAVK